MRRPAYTPSLARPVRSALRTPCVAVTDVRGAFRAWRGVDLFDETPLAVEQVRSSLAKVARGGAALQAVSGCFQTGYPWTHFRTESSSRAGHTCSNEHVSMD